MSRRVRCVRCEQPGTVLVHQVDAGSADAPVRPGPRTANVYACVPHARAIAAEPGAPAWLAVELLQHGTTRAADRRSDRGARIMRP